MDMNRREFVGLMSALPFLAAGKPDRGNSLRWWTMVSDPNSYDSESMRGYRSAMPEAWPRWADATTLARPSLLLAPYCVSLLPAVLEYLTRTLHGGATVVMETGAGYASHHMFRQHRRWVREHLGIQIAARIDLWANPDFARAPYIDFTWPRPAKIRDFSRVVAPAVRLDDAVIAWAGDLAVGTRRRVGKGTLIYLGSPVGPALWAGDVEARRWLHAVALAA